MNICWGHAVSKYLVHWEHVKSNPVLKPDKAYDHEGVFTGCFYPTGQHGETHQLTAFYTSVCYLPVHWSIPYVRGSEGLAMASSVDGGLTWQKTADNPILSQEPEGIHVTGWRDPYLGTWELMDRLRNERSLYGTVAGGIHGEGPRLFIYAVSPTNLARWEYLGPLVELPRHFRPSLKWDGDFGLNWECTNFMTLNSEAASLDFIITGSEGGETRKHIQAAAPSYDLPQRVVRWALWICGRLVKRQDSSIRFERDFSGILDHGCYYAVNSFYDPVVNRRVLWGWLPEEDVRLKYCQSKGWNGCLAMPREVFLFEMFHVVRALRSSLSDISCMSIRQGPDGLATLRSLGIKPLREIPQLRKGRAIHHSNISLPCPESRVWETSARSKQFELQATLNIGPGTSRAGLYIRHNVNNSTRTAIYFVLDDEEIVVDRSQSNTDPDINNVEERGPHTLFVTRDSSGEEAQERLHLQVFCDHDVLEVFANGRFALATMVYTQDPEALNISCFAHGQIGSTTFEDIQIWEQMGSIFSGSS